MPKPKGAGDLRQKVHFERRVELRDDDGNAVEDWGVIGTQRSASLLPMRGGETVQAGRVQGRGMFDLWVRYDGLTSTITTADRVVSAGCAYNIKWGPEDMDGRRQWLLFQIEDGGASG
jgi:SPP1 family predicted phage head-tail adaptor